MTKTHPHLPSEKVGVKFKVEHRRFPAWYAGESDDVRYFVVEEHHRFELGPWFYKLETASEIAEKATNGDQFCNAIPCCDYGTAIPRPEGSWYRPQEYVDRKDVTVR